MFYRTEKKSAANKEVILLLQGRNECTGMYDHVAKYLVERSGKNVFYYDVRGQGKSSGIRGHVDSFDQHLYDLNMVVNHLRDSGFSRIKIVSHSTGALLAALYAASFPGALGEGAALILSSPFFRPKGSRWEKWALQTVSQGLSFIPGGSLFSLKFLKESTEFAENDLTNDKDFFGRFAGHPEKCGPPTWGWVRSVLQAQKDLWRKKADIPCPILVLTAGNDSVVDNEATREFCEFLQCPSQEFSGQRHVLFMAPLKVREKVLKKVEDFLVG